MNHYVNLRHPHRIGVIIQVVAVGQTRTTDNGRIEALGRVITPKAEVDSIWFTKEDILLDLQTITNK